jgi:hypothetical protein
MKRLVQVSSKGVVNTEWGVRSTCLKGHMAQATTSGDVYDECLTAQIYKLYTPGKVVRVRCVLAWLSAENAEGAFALLPVQAGMLPLQLIPTPTTRIPAASAGRSNASQLTLKMGMYQPGEVISCQIC